MYGALRTLRAIAKDSARERASCQGVPPCDHVGDVPKTWAFSISRRKSWDADNKSAPSRKSRRDFGTSRQQLHKPSNTR